MPLIIILAATAYFKETKDCFHVLWLCHGYGLEEIDFCKKVSSGEKFETKM